MKQKAWIGAALGVALLGMITTAQAITMDVYTVGSTYMGDGQSTVGAWHYDDDDIAMYAAGSSLVQVLIQADFTGWAALSIVAEGIDTGEIDNVYFGTANSYTDNRYLGTLTQQTTYSNSFFIKQLEGALDGTTALTTTFFSNNIRVEKGITYLLSIVIGTPRWVNEIETVSLTPVPEPTTMLLLGTGLVGLAAITRRKRN